MNESRPSDEPGTGRLDSFLEDQHSEGNLASPSRITSILSKSDSKIDVASNYAFRLSSRNPIIQVEKHREKAEAVAFRFECHMKA